MLSEYLLSRQGTDIPDTFIFRDIGLTFETVIKRRAGIELLYVVKISKKYQTNIS